MNPIKGEASLQGAALIAALFIVAAWLGLLGWLAFHTGASEVEWARLLAVLGSLEAVAFAAAGALFGTTIQRRRVEEAKERATKAEDRAAQAEKSSMANAQAAVNGKALATAIKARRTRSSAQGVERVSTGHAQEAVTDDLAALAEQLFPDEQS